MTRTVVHLLRHGKVHNPEGILYGRLPGFYLSASGVQMAEAAADALAGRDLGYLAASSLLRAQQTAKSIADRTGLDITTDDRVTEALNVFAGRQVTGNEGTLFRPENWAKLRDPFTPSWGEPYLTVAHRMLGAIYSALQAVPGREAVIVSHQLPIWTVRRFLTGHKLWHNPVRRECGLASLTSLEFEHDVFLGVHYSEPAAHIRAEDDGVEAGA
jgi:broad specificity phosphatase PhoE